MRVVPLEAFRDKVPYSVAIAAVERGFRALGRGEAALPDPMVLELREQQAEVHVKGAHLAGGRHIEIEHTSELQSRFDLVCRLLLEKKKKKSQRHNRPTKITTTG